MTSSGEMLDEFRLEMREMAQGIDENLLRWEASPEDQELPDRLFRQLHTLKGSAGFLELHPLADLCHAAEDFLSPLRKAPRAPTRLELDGLGAVMAAVLRWLEAPSEEERPSLDALTEAMRGLARGEAVPGEAFVLQEPDVAPSSSRGKPMPSRGLGAEKRGSRRRQAYVAPQTPARRPPPSRVRRKPLPEPPPPEVPLEESSLLGSSLLGTALSGPDPVAFSLGPWRGDDAVQLEEPSGSFSSLDLLGVGLEPGTGALRRDRTPGNPDDALISLAREPAAPSAPGWRGESVLLGATPRGSTRSGTGGQGGAGGSADNLPRDPIREALSELSDARAGLSGKGPSRAAEETREVLGRWSPGLEGPEARLPPRGSSPGIRVSGEGRGTAPARGSSPQLPLEDWRPAEGSGDLDLYETLSRHAGAVGDLARKLGEHQLSLLVEPLFPELEAAGRLAEARAQEGLSRRPQASGAEPGGAWLGLGRGAGEDVSGTPPAAEWDPDDHPTLMDVRLPGPRREQLAEEERASAGPEGATVPTLQEPGGGIERASGRPTGETSGEEGLAGERAATVRVEVTRLDVLLNLVGDLLQEKYRQGALVESLVAHLGQHPLAESLVESNRRLKRMLGELQTAVLNTRMLPLQEVFRRCPRFVRETSARLHKEVELVVRGEDTELDRTLIEGLIEPLIHLLRNAIDHGIEQPEVRTRAGKPRRGVIQLTAAHEGNQLVLEVRDDGRGISPEEVGKRALDLGMIDATRLADLTPQEKVELIFLPGFSSREVAGDLSGRGVGMNLVRDHLRRIGGLLTVLSAPGEGTTIRIVMPLTLAIMQVLLARVGELVVALPLASVLGVQRVARERLTLYRGTWYLPRGNAMLPLLGLSSLLGVEGSQLPPARCNLVVVGVAEKRYGLWVDGFNGIFESVIRNLEGSLTRLPGVTGGTFLAGGELVLVIDPGLLLEGRERTSSPS